MRATEALRLAHAHGVRVRIADGVPILEADHEPEAWVVNALRECKDEIIALLSGPESVNDPPPASHDDCPLCQGTNLVTDVAGQYCVDCRQRITGAPVRDGYPR
jgi:hypothetical protein